MKAIDHLSDLASMLGQPLGTSDWILVDQPMIDAFADTTRDAQWIHVDPARAADGPFGAPIAHGFLTVSLLSAFGKTAFHIADVRMGVNAGFDRLRMTAPVPVNRRVRAHFVVHRFEPVEGGAKLTLDVKVELEGSDKPACVAHWLVRQYT